jgi:hypothetical protein
VSDISLGPGLGVAVGFLLTAFAAGALIIVGLLVATATSLAPGERRWQRIVRCCIPALVCFGVGLAYLVMGGLVETATEARMDDWAFGVPVAAVTLGVGVGVVLARRRRRRRIPDNQL